MAGEAQHYIPQFYLRNFAKKRKRRYYLECYDKSDRRRFVSNVANIAQETSFYDIPDDPIAGPAAEEYLQRSEPNWARAITSGLAKPSAILRPDIRAGLAEFAASLMSRTPALRAEVAQMATDASKKLVQDGAVLRQPSERELKQLQTSLLIKQTPLYSAILTNMSWMLVINDTSTPFWASDNPLIKYNPEKDELRGNLGLLSRGIQLYLPLSSSAVLAFVDPAAYPGLPITMNATEPVVEFCNSGQVISSLRYLFSRQAQFQLADSILRANPQLAHPNRPRVIVT